MTIGYGCLETDVIWLQLACRSGYMVVLVSTACSCWVPTLADISNLETAVSSIAWNS
jgi:hypothetical protein